MKVVLDTNVYISFLLGTGTSSPPGKVVTTGIEGSYSIICSEQLIAERTRKVSTKPYLASRIPPTELDFLVRTLTDRAIFIDDDFQELPEFSRDRNDDFLIMVALLGRADYLVSGDPDLLVLKEFEDVAIVSPAEFVELLGL